MEYLDKYDPNTYTSWLPKYVQGDHVLHAKSLGYKLQSQVESKILVYCRMAGVARKRAWISRKNTLTEKVYISENANCTGGS